MQGGSGRASGIILIALTLCGCGAASERPEGWSPERGPLGGGDDAALSPDAGQNLGGASHGSAAEHDEAGSVAGAEDGADDPVLVEGRAGSAACREGATESCWGFVEQVHDIRYCWEGRRVCRDGQWSPCEPPNGPAVPTAR